MYLVREGSGWLVLVDRTVNPLYVPRSAVEASWPTKNGNEYSTRSLSTTPPASGTTLPSGTTLVAEVPKAWPVLKDAAARENQIPELERLETVDYARVSFSGVWKLLRVEGDIDLFTKELGILNSADKDVAYVEERFVADSMDGTSMSLEKGTFVTIVDKKGSWATVKTAAGKTGDVPLLVLQIDDKPVANMPLEIRSPAGYIMKESVTDNLMEWTCAKCGPLPEPGTAIYSDRQSNYDLSKDYVIGNTQIIEHDGNDLTIDCAMKSQTLHVGGGEQRIVNLEDGLPIIVQAMWVDDGDSLLLRGKTEQGKAIPKTKWFLAHNWSSTSQMVIQSTSPLGTTVRRVFEMK